MWKCSYKSVQNYYKIKKSIGELSFGEMSIGEMSGYRFTLVYIVYNGTLLQDLRKTVKFARIYTNSYIILFRSYSRT